MTPAKVLESVKWISDGHIYRLGRPYEQGMPLYGTRSFAMSIPGSPTGGPFGDNTPDFFALDNLQLAAAAVPEPATLALAAVGVAGTVWAVRRRRRLLP